jgi:hypothetical protein
MAEVCPICCDGFNKSTRRPVECHYCGYSACAECVCRFLLGSHEDPRCMSPPCAKPWIQEFLTRSLTKTFLQGAYLKHREAVLYGRELGYMPATQLEIEKDVRTEEVNRRIAEVRGSINAAYDRRSKAIMHPTNVRVSKAGFQVSNAMQTVANTYMHLRVLRAAPAPDVEQLGQAVAAHQAALQEDKRAKLEHKEATAAMDVSELPSVIAEAKADISRGYSNIRTLTHALHVIRLGGGDVGDAGDAGDVGDAGEGGGKARRAFVRACPADGCKGFLSTAWKCGLCNVHVCKECHEISDGGEGGDHVCCPESVATAKLLAKDTRTCPTCASLIFKIDGCDQMFCVQCKTAFSWTSGMVVKSGIHNPHYYEWLRSSGGEVPRTQQPACDVNGVPPAHVISMLLRPLHDTEQARSFLEMHRMLQHMRYTELRRYQEMRPVDVAANMDVRKRFMRGEIDEPRLKATLQRREKRRRKDHEYRQVLSMLVQVGGELIMRFRDDNNNDNGYTKKGKKQMLAELIVTLAEFNRLRVYANDSLRAIGVRYACMHPEIAPDWSFSKKLHQNGGVA